MPTVVAFLYPQPDKRDEVRAALVETIPLVHEEPGCNLYSLHETPDRFVFVESWASPRRWLSTARRRRWPHCSASWDHYSRRRRKSLLPNRFQPVIPPRAT